MRSRRATPRAPRQAPEERRTNLLSAAYAPETYFGVAHFCFWLLVIGAGCATFDSRPNIIFGVNSTLHELMDVVWKFCLWVGVAGLGLVLGAKLVNKLMGVRPASPKAIINSVHLPPSPLFNWVLAACIPVMVFAIVKTGAIERDSYIMEDSRGGGLFNVLSYVILLMPALCGIAFVQKGRSLILCGTVLLLAFLYNFGHATRGVAGVPVLFGAVVALGYFRKSIWKSIVVMVISFALGGTVISLSLKNRNNVNSHGIIPYLKADLKGENTQKHEGREGGSSLSEATSAMFEVSLQTYIAYEGKAKMSDFKVAVSPLPSSMVGWQELSRLMRLHNFVPYSGAGELMSHGLWITFFYYFVYGAVLAFLLLLLESFGPLRNLGFMMLLAVFAMHSVLMCQYNLRSCTRIIYYIFFLITGAAVAKYIFVELLSKREEGHHVQRR